MNDNQRKEIMNIADTIHGEVNRMCITTKLTELDTMYSYAKTNLEKLQKLIYDAKFYREEKNNVRN